MAKQEAPTPEVNLLPGEDLESRPGGKFLKWALTWGKRIVIVTELIVILAFFSRFWLDTTVANLSEQIQQKRAIVQTSADFEKRFRSLSVRVDKVKALDKLTSTLLIYDQARSFIPAGVTLSSLSVSGREVALSGSGLEQDLASLVAAFKKSSKFSDLTVDKVAKTDVSPTVNFSLKANYVTLPGS